MDRPDTAPTARWWMDGAGRVPPPDVKPVELLIPGNVPVAFTAHIGTDATMYIGYVVACRSPEFGATYLLAPLDADMARGDR